MAITFRGSIPSATVIGNDALTQNISTITNKIGSRVNIIIRRATVQVDTLAVLTSVMPLVKLSRATSISGGAILSKSAWTTTQSSSDSVEVRTAVADGQPITATAGDTVWQQYCHRMHTAVEQVLAPENNILPMLVENKDFILRPGESILVRVVGFSTASNAALSTNWWTAFMWEEDEIATFAISGTVTLSGSPVTGAQVVVIESDDLDMTNAVLKEVITTPAGGTWASTIKTGKIGAAFVQYESGGTYYTANGSPFLS
jgi:hypothetical protein